MVANKISNEYAQALGDLFDRAPKAVIAAVAVSLLSTGGDDIDTVGPAFLAEWRVLHDNGIVSQKPPK